MVLRGMNMHMERYGPRPSRSAASENLSPCRYFFEFGHNVFTFVATIELSTSTCFRNILEYPRDDLECCCFRLSQVISTL